MAHEFTTRRRVEFADTDCAGIIHFTHYFRYMEEAEHAFLRSLGLSVRWPAEGGEVGFPRLAASCEFLRPVRFEDVLDIHLLVKRKGRTSLTYRFSFSLGGEAVARGEVTAVSCLVRPDGTVRPIALPAAFAEGIEEAPEPSEPSDVRGAGGTASGT